MSITKNTVFNVLGTAIPIPLAIVVVPFFLKAIGPERYGVMAIAFVILGYFGLMNLGLGRAVAQKVARLRNEPREREAEVIINAVVLNIGLGLVAALLVGPAAWGFFTYFMDMETGLRDEALSASIWLSLALPLTMISGVFSGALQGREQFLSINAVNVLGAVLGQIAPLLAAWYIAPTLPVVLPAAFVSRMVVLALLAWLCHRRFPFARPWRVSRRMMIELLQFGGWVTVTSIIGPFLDLLDRLIIGAVVGAAAVTIYVIPTNLLRRVMSLSSGLSNALFPRFASMRESAKEQDLLDRAARALIAILTPMFVVGGLILDPFISLWIDPEFAASAAPVGAVFSIGVWINCLAMLPFSLLQGTGRPDLIAKCHLVEIVPYLAILAISISYYGVLGAAMAWTLRCIADAVLLFFIGFHARKRILAIIMPPFALVTVNVVSILALPADGAAKWQVGGILLAVSLVISWVTMPKDVLMRIPGFRWLRVEG